MKKDEVIELRAYVKALEDTGVYDPNSPVSPEYEEFVSERELEEEVKDSGNWLIRVYKNYGTIFEKEYLRVYAEKEGKITAAPPSDRESEIPVGPQSVIRLFVEKIREADRRQAARKGEPKVREPGKESEAAGDKF
jgi:hypothetical protein